MVSNCQVNWLIQERCIAYHCWLLAWASSDIVLYKTPQPILLPPISSTLIKEAPFPISLYFLWNFSPNSHGMKLLNFHGWTWSCFIKVGNFFEFRSFQPFWWLHWLIIVVVVSLFYSNHFSIWSWRRHWNYGKSILQNVGGYEANFNFDECMHVTPSNSLFYRKYCCWWKL